MHKILIKSDSNILKDVNLALEYDPSFDSNQIDVSVKDGIVTLNGTVAHYSEKLCAENATQKVQGVRAISDELEVNLSNKPSDDSIAKAALSLLDWNYLVPEGIVPIVENGWVTLRGTVEFECEKESAFATVKGIKGLHGVINDIVVLGQISEAMIKEAVEKALVRSAKDDSEQIKVAVTGGLVNLWGSVSSASRMREAREAAWSAAGVSKVTDFLTVG